MGAVLLLLVAAGAAAGWLWRTGRLGDVIDRARDLVAGMYPSRPISRRALPRRLLRAAERTVTVGVSGTILVPTRIHIEVNPGDLDAFTDAIEWLQRDIGDALRQKAADNGWMLPDGPHVTIAADSDRPVGAPRAVGRIDAFKPEDVHTLVRPGQPPADELTGVTAAPHATHGDDVPTAPIAHAVHLRLVASEAGTADLSAVVTSLEEPMVLGRSRDAALRVKDHQVSGRHCSFAVDPDEAGLIVQDLGSTNGTFVDGQRIDQAAVATGGTLRVGRCSWRVELDELTG